jgi:hypothetical protein
VLARVGRPEPPEPEPRLELNRLFDAAVGPHPGFAHVHAAPALLLHWAGLACGVVLAVGVASARGASTMLAVSAATLPVAVLMLLQALRRSQRDRRQHVPLQDVLLAFLVPAVLASVLDVSVTTMSAMAALGLGSFIAFTRLGCMVEGCCHGRPARIGVRHRPRSADDLLAGVRLFPVPLVEAAWVLAITVCTCVLALLPAAEGAAPWFWLLSYAAGRAVLDVARGDALARLGPLTHAQWWAVAIVSARAVQEGLVAGRPGWVGALGAGAALVGLGLLLHRPRSHPGRARFDPEDVPQWQRLFADLERDAAARPGSGEVARLSPDGRWQVGLSIDPSDDSAQLHSYSLRPLHVDTSMPQLWALGGLVLQRLPQHRVLRSWCCVHGALHLWVLVEPDGTPGSTLADLSAAVLLRAQAFALVLRDLPRLAPGAGDASQARPQLPALPETSGAGAWYFRDTLRARARE